MPFDVDEGNPAGALAARIGTALDMFAKMRDDVPEMQIRVYDRHRAYPWCAATAG